MALALQEYKVICAVKDDYDTKCFTSDTITNSVDTVHVWTCMHNLLICFALLSNIYVVFFSH